MSSIRNSLFCFGTATVFGAVFCGVTAFGESVVFGADDDTVVFLNVFFANLPAFAFLFSRSNLFCNRNLLCFVNLPFLYIFEGIVSLVVVNIYEERE